MRWVLTFIDDWWFSEEEVGTLCLSILSFHLELNKYWDRIFGNISESQESFLWKFLCGLCDSENSNTKLYKKLHKKLKRKLFANWLKYWKLPPCYCIQNLAKNISIWAKNSFCLQVFPSTKKAFARNRFSVVRQIEAKPRRRRRLCNEIFQRKNIFPLCD